MPEFRPGFCPYCKEPAHMPGGCEESKKAFDDMDRRVKSYRDSSMSEEREWPLKEYLLKEWTAHGLPCAVMSGEFALCGYVKIPAGHPDAGKHYDDVDVSVHGGLTFTCKAVGGGRWFGFDCGHAGDWLSMPGFGEHPGRIWTLEDVVKETEDLARQLAAIAIERKK